MTPTLRPTLLPTTVSGTLSTPPAYNSNISLSSMTVSGTLPSNFKFPKLASGIGHPILIYSATPDSYGIPREVFFKLLAKTRNSDLTYGDLIDDGKNKYYTVSSTGGEAPVSFTLNIWDSEDLKNYIYENPDKIPQFARWI